MLVFYGELNVRVQSVDVYDKSIGQVCRGKDVKNTVSIAFIEFWWTKKNEKRRQGKSFQDGK